MHARMLLIGLSVALLMLAGWGTVLWTRNNSMEKLAVQATIPAIDRSQPAVTETATFGLG